MPRQSYRRSPLLFMSLWLVGGSMILILPSVVAGEIDPQQMDWYEKYKEQENAPDPGEMELNVDDEPNLEEGFTALFNGHDLSGWRPLGGTSTFEATDGQIVGTCKQGSKSTYLCTEKSDFEDFIFTCDINWIVECNTGVQFRSRSKPGGKNDGDIDETKIVYGPQVEMEELSKDRGWSGGIYGQSCGGYFYPVWLKKHAEAREAPIEGQWNRVTISAKGNVVKTWINGIPVSHWVGDGTYDKGFFGLQIHAGRAGTVAFKNLRIKELP